MRGLPILLLFTLFSLIKEIAAQNTIDLRPTTTTRKGYHWVKGSTIEVKGMKKYLPGRWESLAESSENIFFNELTGFYEKDITQNIKTSNHETTSKYKDYDGEWHKISHTILSAIRGSQIASMITNEGRKDVKKWIIYARSLDLRWSVLPHNKDYLFVVDTLYINGSGISQISKDVVSNALELELGKDKLLLKKKYFVKIISSVIIFEEKPINVLLQNDIIVKNGSKVLVNESLNNGDFGFCTNKVFSISKKEEVVKRVNVKLFERKGLNGNSIAVERGKFNVADKKQVDLWVTKTLEKIADLMENESNLWEIDRLYNYFIKSKLLFTNSISGGNFSEICQRIKDSYVKKNAIGIRTIKVGGNKDIMINAYQKYGKYDEEIRYTLVPTRAKLMPLLKNKKELIGAILALNTQPIEYELELNLLLTYDVQEYQEIKKNIQKTHKIYLDTLFESMKIAEQPFKVKNNESISSNITGKITPISSSILHCVVNLGTSAQQIKILNIFTPNQTNQIQVSIKGSNDGKPAIALYLPFVIPKYLLEQLNETKYSAALFDTYIYTDQFTDWIQLESHFNPVMEGLEGQEFFFDMLEINLTITCGNKIEIKGPYYLGSYYASSSKQKVLFTKSDTHCEVKVSGYAKWNGTSFNIIRTIEEFALERNIAIINESVLKNTPQ